MPKLHYVKKARKSNRKLGIQKGLPYWFWKRRAPGQVEGRKCVSLTKPRPSQLAGSPYKRQRLMLEEELEDATELIDLQVVQAGLMVLANEQREKYSNMRESLQRGPTGQLLLERERECRERAESINQLFDEMAEELQDREDADAAVGAEQEAGD